MSFADGWGSSASSSNPFGREPASYQHTPYSDAPDDEYAQAHAAVYENIKQMTGDFGLISNMAKAIGTGKDGARHREQLNTKIAATQNLVRSTQASIRTMMNIVQASNAATRKERKQKVDKLSSDFEKFNDKFKQLVSITQSKMDETILPSPKTSNPFSFDYTDEDDERDRQEAQRRQQEVLRLNDEREFQDSLISERDAQIRTIQGQMVEVNDIFKDLARLVEDQGEMVDNIQTNVTTAATHVDTAVSELKTASEYQESSRKKLCFIAIFVVIVVAIAVTVILVLTNKKS